MNPEPKATKTPRTAQALADAARRLIAEGRIHGATIDTIASEAAVAKRSFHNHFRDREALIDHAVGEVRAQIEAAVLVANAGVQEPAERLTRGLLASFRFGLDDPVGARVMLYLTAGVADPTSRRNQALVDNLRDGQDSGAFRLPSLDAGVVLVLGLSDLGISRLVRLHDERPRARALMRSISVMMLRALSVNPRRIEALVASSLAAVIDAEPADPAATGQRAARRTVAPRGTTP